VSQIFFLRLEKSIYLKSSIEHVTYSKLGLHAANDAKYVIARPWRLDDWLGIAGKDCRNCLWSLESRVACHWRPLSRN